jgi:hypothetical protein
MAEGIKRGWGGDGGDGGQELLTAEIAEENPQRTRRRLLCVAETTGTVHSFWATQCERNHRKWDAVVIPSADY